MTQEEALEQLVEIDKIQDHDNKLVSIYAHSITLSAQKDFEKIVSHPIYKKWIKDNSGLIREVKDKVVMDNGQEVLWIGDTGYIVEL